MITGWTTRAAKNATTAKAHSQLGEESTIVAYVVSICILYAFSLDL